MTRSEIEGLNTEGERGIEDLARMARELVYKGFCDQLQLNNGCFVTDILSMLEAVALSPTRKLVLWPFR